VKVLASDNGVKEITVDGSAPLKRAKDGTFHVPERLGRGMVKGSEFAQVGTNFQKPTIPGYRCTNAACGHLGLFRDKCGRCGCTDLVRED
jgi:hypothetical protein